MGKLSVRGARKEILPYNEIDGTRTLIRKTTRPSKLVITQPTTGFDINEPDSLVLDTAHTTRNMVDPTPPATTCKPLNPC